MCYLENVTKKLLYSVCFKQLPSRIIEFASRPNKKNIFRKHVLSPTMFGDKKNSGVFLKFVLFVQFSLVYYP